MERDRIKGEVLGFDLDLGIVLIFTGQGTMVESKQLTERQVEILRTTWRVIE